MATPNAQNKANLTFQEDGHTVDLTLFDQTYAFVRGVSSIQRFVQVRDRQIKRKGNVRRTLDALTTKSQLVQRQARAIERIHGDLQDETFRFKADRYPYEELGP